MVKGLVWAGSIFFLSACAMPGIQDLEQQGLSETFDVQGNHRQIATCVVRALDNEPARLGEMQVPASRVMQAPDDKSIELQAGFPQSPSVLMWRAVVSQTPGMTVSAIALTARRDVNPFLSDTYVFSKVKQAFLSCAEPPKS